MAMNVKTDKVLDLASRLQRRPTVGRIYRLRSTERALWQGTWIDWPVTGIGSI
jgi:hypothetical protein